MNLSKKRKMRNRIIVFIGFLCFFVCWVQAAGEHYYFKNFSIKDGLPQTTVNAIMQDKKGFMWFGTKGGLSRYDGVSFRNFKRNMNDNHSLGNNFITCLYEDKGGNIWVGTDAGVYIYYSDREIFMQFNLLSKENTRIERTVSAISGDKEGRIWVAVETQGLFCYEPQKEILHNYALNNISANVQSVISDNSGTIWIGFYGCGLFYSKDDLKTLHPYIYPKDGKEIFKDDVIMKIVHGSYNCLYISSIRKGVLELNLTSGNLRSLLSIDETGEKVYSRDLLVNSNNELWIGTESGVYIYNLRTDKYVHLQSTKDDPYSLSDNAVYSLYEDREDGIWVGSYFGGVDYYPKSYTYFEKYYPKDGNNSLHGKRVREFCEDNNGILWIGTEDGGLNRFNPKEKIFSFFVPSSGFTNIQSLCMVGDKLWVGTFSKGLKIVDINTGSILKTYQKTASSRSLIDNSIFAICRTTIGDVYIGTMFGLLKYNDKTDDFDRIEELSGKFIYDIKEDSDGNIWLATYVNGAYCYNVNERKWKNYVHSESNKESISCDKVLSVFEDSHRQIWLTTQGGGFCLFHPETETFTNYNSSNGLPNDVVYQIVEDKEGLFWLTTNSGLVRFSPETKQVKNYTTANGLLGNQFNYRSSYKDENGSIYFGSIDGFVVFNPKTFTENKDFPPVVITDFMLFNKEVSVDDENTPLKRSITFSDSITLQADQNSFSFRIAALGYQAPQVNRLMYKLDGFDKDWIKVGESPIVTYSNLRYGDYIFCVKVSNSEGVWGTEERLLFVRILPPFYLSFGAYCIYLLLFISVFAYLFWYFRQRSNRLHRRQFEKFEQEKEREIYNAKIDFFTNVAHEIRTPLTLIKGPLENILLKKHLDSETHEDLNIMQHNTERLLELTNQLLDFRKVESQGYSLNFIRCDITNILKETYMRFSSFSRQKGLDLNLELPEENFYAHVNREAFTKIISNLLNNGMKYADSYVHIKLEIDAEKQVFYVITKNDGVIIPNDMKEEIFQPFVRFSRKDGGKLASGAGIGLALSRSLAELHRGTLIMLPDEDVNVFVLTLPIIQDMVINLDADIEHKDIELQSEITDEQYSEDCSDGKQLKENRHTILIVEDNLDMLAFIERQMSSRYAVVTATNGREALDALDRNFVNLVVSDVVMPLMDGFELCKTIKSNVGYSHIPVILLTAKTNIQSKIEGMELGADSYIEKPFSSEYLLAVVSNLINNREKLRRDFAQSPFVAVNTMALTKADEEFIKKLNDIILSNLSNQDFSMDDMAECLNMSRSSFYRKMKGVLDLSPNEYLRIERLKRAAQLLKEGKCRINEICYMVGFSSSSYFSKCFLKQFGVLPKDFAG